MTAGPLLELAGVSKRFGSIIVADSLSLVVRGGDAVGMVGPNGAGKTSLFSLISGDLSPNSGEVHFEGRAVTRLDSAQRCRLGIARTYQVPRSFEHMTVFENVLVAAYRGAGLRGHAASSLAAGVLDEADLRKQANSPASRLGLVQRKRLELARALGCKPRLLLLDEVAAGLTEPEVAGLVEVIERIRARGVSIPVAVSVFPDELYPAPRSWAERAYPKLIHYNKLDKGGHFAAWEQPKLFSEEVRAGFRSLR